MIEKTYYALDNHRASETSKGFANTWFVLRFPSRRLRDDYIRRATSIAARPVTAREARKYL
jgi:hypothetical protein